MVLRPFLAALALIAAGPVLAAPQSISVHGDWGAFRDAKSCHAVAMVHTTRKQPEIQGFATVLADKAGRVSVHVRLSRAVAKGAAITLEAGNRRFRLLGNEYDARARPEDARPIVDALRRSDTMTVGTKDWKGQRLRDVYRLAGAPTAIDAALVACA